MIYDGAHREAPAIVKKGNLYYLITSGASGWYPNQAMYSTATNINGPWSALQPLGNSSTFYTQPAFILTIQGNNTTSHMYVGDRWKPGQLSDSRYVWLPLTLNGTSATMDYYDSISVDAVSGVVSGLSNGTLLSQGRPAFAQSALGAQPASYANDGNYQTEWVATGSTWPHSWTVDLGAVRQVKNVQISWWMMNGSEGYYRYKIETSTDNVSWSVALDRSSNTTYGFTSDVFSSTARYVRINMQNAVLHNNPNNWYTPRLWEVKVYGDMSGGGNGTNYLKIRNAATGLYLDGIGRTSNGSELGQWEGGSSYNQQWVIEPAGSYVKIKNRATGLYIDGMGRTTNGSAAAQYSSSGSDNQQWQQVSSGTNVRFVNRGTGLYLDGMGRTTNGNDAGQWSNSGSTNQQWVIETVN